MKKIGLFGGTFNPIHLGHMKIAKTFYEKLHLDEMIVMPAKVPVHKESKGLAPAADRLEMCRIAIKDIPHFSVSDFELNSDKPSYTVYTLREFEKHNKDAKFYLIIGSDMLFTLDEWFLYEEILQRAVVCAAARLEGDRRQLERYKSYYEEKGGQVEIVDMPPLAISSMEIRGMIARGEDAGAYLDPRVLDYIRQRGLYQVG